MKKEFIVRQNDIQDCGICCLLSVIKYYKGFIPLEKLRLDTKTDRNGATAYNLINTAIKYGFNACGKKIDVLNDEIILPAIAHLEYENGLNHFVVIYKITKQDVYIMNPAKGYEKKSLDDFKKIWTNVILVFKPYRDIPFYKYNNSLKKLILLVFKNDKSLIMKIFFLNLFIALLSLFLGYFFQIAMYFINNSFMKLLFTLIIFLVLYSLKTYSNYVRNDLAICLNKNIDLSLIPSFIFHIFKLPLNVIKGRTSGELMVRIREMENIKELFSEIIIAVCMDLLLVILSCVFLFTINKALFLILCLLMVIYCILGICMSPYVHMKLNDNIDAETEFNSFLVEKMEGIESIKNLNYVKESCSEIEDLYVNYQANTFSYLRFLNAYSFPKNLIKEVGVYIILCIGFILIFIGKLKFIELVTFNCIVSFVVDPIENVIGIIPKFLLIKLSLTKANEFLNVSEEKEGDMEEFVNGDIVFSNVSFSYDSYQNIFTNCNLRILKNDHITLKGKSGCGKSTLCKFLNRSIDDYLGNVMVGERNIKDYSLKTIRSNVLYVSQRENLFTGTIRKNIVLSSEVSNEELSKILHMTMVDELLSKKCFKLDSLLFDSGFNLSGGERQRIVLARALVRKPKILILDEALNQVDQDCERFIMTNLDSYLKDTTLIYVSHNSLDFLGKKLEFKS